MYIAIDMTQKAHRIGENPCNIHFENTIYESMSQDEPTLEIGRLIEAELRRQQRSVSWLGRQINCDRRNVYNIFTRRSIDTEMLLKISRALRVDFFAVYTKSLRFAIRQSITPPGQYVRSLIV